GVRRLRDWPRHSRNEGVDRPQDESPGARDRSERCAFRRPAAEPHDAIDAIEFLGQPEILIDERVEGEDDLPHEVVAGPIDRQANGVVALSGGPQGIPEGAKAVLEIFDVLCAVPLSRQEARFRRGWLGPGLFRANGLARLHRASLETVGSARLAWGLPG